MPKLKIKKPCNDCPWRRNAFPGWLGSDEPESFCTKQLRDEEMPCHKTIDYTDPDWLTTQMPEAAFCAGGLIFLANYCKLPRDPELAAAVKAVERDEKVFAYPAEFVAYHGGEVQMKNLRTQEEGVLTKTRDVRSKFVLRVGDAFREAERIEELVHEGWTVIDYMLT
jgi:hypothetical protein